MRHKAPAQRADTRWTDADTQHLRDGLDTLSVPLDERAFGLVVRWATLLKQWNRTFNLLGNSNSAELIDEHLLDSLVVLPALQKLLPNTREPLFDIGTGAGFPGILLAIAQPERPIYLVEPVGKKVAFLRQSVLTLGLTNATVLAGKIEELDALLSHSSPGPLSGMNRGRNAAGSKGSSGDTGVGIADSANVTDDTGDDTCDMAGARSTASPARQSGSTCDASLPRHFICRAFTALGHFAELCQPYMSERSLALAMRAARLPEEQEGLPATITMAAVETLPTRDGRIQRYLAVLKLRHDANRITQAGADDATAGDRYASSPGASNTPSNQHPLISSAEPDRRRFS